MTPDFQVRLMKAVNEARIQVHCYYSTRRSHLRAEPLRDGSSASSNLKALPSVGDAERPDATESPRIKALLEQLKALPCFMPGIIKSISAHACLQCLHQPVNNPPDNKRLLRITTRRLTA